MNYEFVIWLAGTGVPAGDGCRFNFVPVRGRERGCGFVNPLPAGNVPVAIHIVFSISINKSL